MNPIGRFSTTSMGPAGLGAVIGCGVAIGLDVTGRVNVFGGAGGRLKGLTSGSSAIWPSYEKSRVRLQGQSQVSVWPEMAHICLRVTVRSGVRHAGGAPRVVHESTAFPNVKFDRMDAASRGVTRRSPPEMPRRAGGT